MKAVYTVVLLSLLMTAAAFSQSYVWQHMGIFPPSKGVVGDTVFGPGVHGIAVDPDGKVWIQHYYALPKDSILVPNFMVDKDTTGGVDSIEARKINIRALHVYNKDGSEASFSPIYNVNVDGKWDTLGGFSYYAKGKLVWGLTYAGLGLRADHEGNILAVYKNNVIYRINYKTGAGMNKIVIPLQGGTATPAHVSPGVDQDGNIFINRVYPAFPLVILDKNGTYIQNGIDTTKGFSRTTTVSKDANDIYFCGYTLNAVLRYHNTSMSGVLGPWDRVDTVMKGFNTEAIDWNPKTGHLWASSGSYTNFPNGYPGTPTTHDTAAWYAYDTKTDKFTGEKINWEFGVPRNANERPRGIAFSPGGDTAYVIVFGGNTQPPPGVRWYTRKLTSVEPVESGIPSGFTLSQNYPNPFNPTTEIQFSITKSGMTTLKVYDMLGQEVATLVNQELNVGTFKSKFDASRLSSGTYIYMLTSNGSRLAKKMMLVK